MNELAYLKKHKKKIDQKDLEKLQNNYPVQYLVGHVDFFNVKIEVNEKVLIPRFETEYFVERIIYYLKKYNFEKSKLLDIGTGSGCIAIALKKELNNLQVTGSDISKQALVVAKKNSLINKVEVDFVLSDLLTMINEKFAVLVSNPPYLAKNHPIHPRVKFEPTLALFAEDDGLFFYKEILKNASKNLESKSIIAFEIGEGQVKAIKKLVNHYFPKAKILFEKDLQNRDRFVFIFNN